MYSILLLSLVFYSIGTLLFALDIVKKNSTHKRKPPYQHPWPEDNVWKDAKEWDAYRFKFKKPDIDLSL